MESIETSTDALSSAAVISFMMEVVAAGQKLAMWVAPAVLALAEHFEESWASFLNLDQKLQPALVDGGTIQMAILKDHPNLSEFDNRVGQTMVLAHLRWGRRIPDLEYQRIAAVVDQRGWKPLRYFEGNHQKNLAIWNQQSGRPIHSFEQALAPKSKFRRAARRGVFIGRMTSTGE